MKLVPLTISYMEQIRQWRNECLESLRTPFPLTQEMQIKFYHDVICNRNANSRYWAIVLEEETTHGKFNLETSKFIPVRYNNLIGMCGIENIEWENRIGEISLILDPKLHNKGYGKEALKLLLDKGFNFLNLDNIYGECYYCNNAIHFWLKMTGKFKGQNAVLSNKKYWEGKYWDSLYFNFNKEKYIISKQPRFTTASETFQCDKKESI